MVTEVGIKLMLFFAIAYYCINTMASESSSITHTLASLQYHLSLLTKKLPSSDPSKSATSTEILSKEDEDAIFKTMQQVLAKAQEILKEESFSLYQDNEQFLYSVILKHSLDKNNIFAIIAGRLSFLQNIQQLQAYWSNWKKGHAIPDSFKQPFETLENLIDEIYKKALKGQSNYYKTILKNFIERLSLFLEDKDTKKFYTDEIKKASTNIDKQAIINYFIKIIGIDPRAEEAFQEYLRNPSSDDNEPDDLKELRGDFNTNIEKVLKILTDSK